MIFEQAASTRFGIALYILFRSLADNLSGLPPPLSLGFKILFNLAKYDIMVKFISSTIVNIIKFYLYLAL